MTDNMTIPSGFSSTDRSHREHDSSALTAAADLTTEPPVTGDAEPTATADVSVGDANAVADDHGCRSETASNRQPVEILCRVVEPLNRHGALTVSAVETHRTYQIVAIANESLQRSLADAASGDRLGLHLRRVGSRGNAWCVVGLASIETAALHAP